MLINAKQTKITEQQVLITRLALAVMFVLSAASGFMPKMLISFGVAAGCGVLWLCGKLYLGFPFVLFYNSVYGLVAGVSVWRIYTLLLLLQIMLRLFSGVTARLKYLPPLLIYVLFLILVMMPNNPREAIFLILDVVGCLGIALELYADADALKQFFRVYAFVCLISFLTGAVIGNKIGNEYTYFRFMATFEDPNYMGFFFTLAIFGIVSLKLFKPLWRALIVIALYAMMLASLSITAIVVNVLLWIFYLAFTRRLRFSTAVVAALGVVAFALLYSYGLENPETPIVGDLASRIEEKLQSLSSGDLDDVTTGRTNLSGYNLDYFAHSPIWKMLIGGTSVNCRYLHPDLHGVSHNEYVDLLLNVGVVGALMMIAFFVGAYLGHVREYRRTKQNSDLCLVMVKTAWLVYAFTLTMFLDFRFMVMFFI